MNDEIVAAATMKLDRISAGQWKTERAEVIEDCDHPYLVIAVSAPDLDEAELTEERRATIFSELQEIIPSHPDQDFGSWMVVFKKHGEVFASVYPGPGGL